MIVLNNFYLLLYSYLHPNFQVPNHSKLFKLYPLLCLHMHISIWIIDFEPSIYLASSFYRLIPCIRLKIAYNLWTPKEYRKYFDRPSGSSKASTSQHEFQDEAEDTSNKVNQKTSLVETDGDIEENLPASVFINQC